MPQTTGPTASLGVGELVSQVFAIFRARFQEVFLISLLYSVVSLAVSLLLIGPEGTFGMPGEAMPPEAGEMGMPAMPPMEIGGGDIANAVVQIFLSALFVAVIALLVVDHADGRRTGAGDYLRRALPAALPVAGLSLVIAVAVALGLLALVLPGLWIFAVLSVAVPAAVIEGAGFSGLGRSAELTRGYRWPIVGFGIVFFLIVIALSVVLGLFVLAPLELLAFGATPGVVGGVLITLVSALVGAAYAGLGALPAPVLYLRLRELKGERG